jgi:Tfp pilus assembly protein PilE
MNRIVNKNWTGLAGRKRQGGFGLLELGLVLLIVSVLGIYAYQQYASNRDESLAQSEVADITSYWAKTQERYSNQQAYTGLDTATLIQANVFPASMTLVANTSVQDKYQGALTAAPGTLKTADDAVVFTAKNYTPAGCASVVPKVANGARKIEIGSTTVKEDGGKLDIKLLGSECSKDTVGDVKYYIGR